MQSLNPHTIPYVSKEQKEQEIKNNNKVDKCSITTDTSEDIHDMKSKNDLIESSDYDKWTNA